MKVSTCCQYSVVVLEINHEDKMFCLNCGQPCGTAIIKINIKSPYGKRNNLALRAEKK